jgi:lipopolysaccharide/colanic/teichoic acid biosynthesis glycosyltransferase
MSAHPRWHRAAKRALDVFVSGSALVFGAPVLALSAAAVAMSLGRPVLFRQQRPGLGGRLFTMYKFRTMRPPTPGEKWFRTDEERLTRVGRFLRRTSIDELPELWNVLRGDMSLVGPRPLLMEYLPKYTATENRRHEVKPGITGWAQVNGRQTIPFSRRLELDVWYVDHFTVWLDLAILVRTARQLFRPGEVISGQNVDDVDDIGLSADRRRTGAGPSGRSE